jgi:hypothetical protein
MINDLLTSSAAIIGCVNWELGAVFYALHHK